MINLLSSKKDVERNRGEEKNKGVEAGGELRGRGVDRRSLSYHSFFKS